MSPTTDKPAERTEIKIGGFGGQGVILSGYILGRAASIYDNKFATMIQAFGPEARGSSCSAQVIVSEKQITYPYITQPTLMVVMSQEAYSKFTPELAPGGLLITEEELVVPHNLRKDVRHYSIPATRFAEELGKKLVVNIVMMGFLTAVTSLIDPGAMRKAVGISVPKGTEELNLKAFDRGYEYGMSLTGKKAPAEGIGV
ncbi:MAG TPA: 2-oxoacid:acceptor oxidoreductase family protein [Bacteroidota bacterium]|nr:2-oxoacid:acceptor oxidoreductase family protein [Bacteroidota bacterium]